MKQLTAICIGAGGRGRAYSNIMSEMPEKFKLIGVAEPVDAAREIMLIPCVPAGSWFSYPRSALSDGK